MNNDFSVEELLPIVAELAEKYTSGESSSVTYERAQGLMQAVLYCIKETGREENGKVLSQAEMSAKEVYHSGYRMVVEKAKKTAALYNEMVCEFQDYGNENYRDTVTKAIPGFLQYYDARFEPYETIITMDYPTITPVTGITGVDAVYEYVKYISFEQQFLNKFPGEYVCSILEKHCRDYGKQFFNLCGIILRHVIVRMLLVGDMTYEGLEELVAGKETDDVEKMLKRTLHRLIEEAYEGDERLENYLQHELRDFAYDLVNGRQYGYLEKVVVII